MNTETSTQGSVNTMKGIEYIIIMSRPVPTNLYFKPHADDDLREGDVPLPHPPPTSSMKLKF